MKVKKGEYLVKEPKEFFGYIGDRTIQEILKRLFSYRQRCLKITFQEYIYCSNKILKIKTKKGLNQWQRQGRCYENGFGSK